MIIQMIQCEGCSERVDFAAAEQHGWNKAGHLCGPCNARAEGRTMISTVSYDASKDYARVNQDVYLTITLNGQFTIAGTGPRLSNPDFGAYRIEAVPSAENPNLILSFKHPATRFFG